MAELQTTWSGNLDEESLERGYISKEDVLDYVTEEDIFCLVFGFKPIEYEYVTSPFREDNNPGCWFERSPKGDLRFVDFANPNTIRGIRMNNIDCFSAVQIYYNFANFYQTLEYIKGRLIDGKNLVRNHLSTEKSEIILPNKEKTKILFKSRDFNSADKDFWFAYGITRKQLIDDHVFAVETFKVVSSKCHITTTPHDVCYCYTDFADSHKKLYRPHHSKRFLTNCIENDVGNIRNLIPNERLFITKSYKDCRVLRNLGLNSIWFQNEGMIPEDKILIPILNKVNNVIIFFDNDETGLRAGQLVNQKIQSLGKKSNNIFLPISLFKRGIKDPSDFIKYKGTNLFIEFLKSRQVW